MIADIIFRVFYLKNARPGFIQEGKDRTPGDSSMQQVLVTPTYKSGSDGDCKDILRQRER